MNIQMLVVDDEQNIREMISRHFRYLGYSVITAANGKEALDLLNKERIEVLISDIMMPEMNGVELLKNIRTDYPVLRPIMITGYVTSENALSCMKYGAETCIFKPIQDLTELESAVNDVILKRKKWQKIIAGLQRMKSD